jgi:IclR family KDG regulon transcriptional repressor
LPPDTCLPNCPTCPFLPAFVHLNNTLVKGLALLEELARSDRPLGVTELARRLDLGKSNVHRLLQGLTELGYARRQESDGSYHASVRLWELGTAILANFDLREIASPYMEALLERTRETVHLSVLDGDEVVYVHKLDSPEPVRAYSEVGGRAPAYCVATGKAMLAWQGEAALQSLAGRLQRHSPKTLDDPQAFLREMERIRSNGFALNRGEWRESVCGVAAPIRDSSNQVIAAIGLSGPAERLRPSMLKALSAPVIEAALGIGLASGGGGRPSRRPSSGGASLPASSVPGHSLQKS